MLAGGGQGASSSQCNYLSAFKLIAGPSSTCTLLEKSDKTKHNLVLILTFICWHKSHAHDTLSTLLTIVSK